MAETRLKWPDFCKFLAMFFVTWGHAAQAISGETFSALLGGKGYLTAFHMPLFFIMSGYFINLDKIREANIKDFVTAKFMRLLLPAFTWTAVYCLLMVQMKSPLSFATFYWYLMSLFLSFLIIMVFTKLFKSNALVILLSICFVVLCPYTDFSNLNFMFPFLWIGYWLRVSKHSDSKALFICALIVSMGLFTIWNNDYTVYLSRFNTATLTGDMVIKGFVRFIMGGAFSYVLIWLSRRFEDSRIVNTLSPLGQYTLTVYTISLIIFGVIRKYCPMHINTPVVVDCLSLALCVSVYYICVKLHQLLSLNKITQKVLLGISK